MLQAVDAISYTVKGTNLNNDIVESLQEAETVISEKLGISQRQSMILALFLQHVFEGDIEISKIFDGTECSTSRKLELMNDIDWLVDNHFLTITKDRHKGNKKYRIPHDVIKSFQHNQKYERKMYGEMTPRAIFCVLEDLFEAKDDDEITYNQLVAEVRALFDANKNMGFVRKVRSCKYYLEETMMLIVFCHLFVNNGDDCIGWHDLKFLYDEKAIAASTRTELLGGCHVLIRDRMVENAFRDGLINREYFKLTEKAKRELLGELHLKSLESGNNGNGIIKYKDIKAKELFFPMSVDCQINELKKILLENNYKKIRHRMKKRGLRCGFACLFYGAPGTGKTETVYQLAKYTGRDVMLVDIPHIRSMWVGESEKNIKGIFDRYRDIVHEARRTPILLFNEADAIIGKRSQTHNSAADKSENTIQNIILQEMENLNGILIATTNLQGNMDMAFERRFLYKIQFDRPDAQSRGKIWHSMIPELSNDTVGKLACKYDFSGGQIENIARHFTIESILKGEDHITLQTLQTYCEQESIKKEKKTIGFNATVN